MVPIYKNEVVVFDLDDLLYKEFDFVRSGYWAIAREVSSTDAKNLFKLMMAKYFLGEPVLDWLCNSPFNVQAYTIDSLLKIYRNHLPQINLSADVSDFLNALKENGQAMGIITDGRSVTQRNKIRALKLDKWVEEIIVSEEFGFEKPSPEAYQYFEDKYKGAEFVYLADNYNKDFIVPNKLGWRTIALRDNGLNIHTCKADLPECNMPQFVIDNFTELVISNKQRHNVSA